MTEKLRTTLANRELQRNCKGWRVLTAAFFGAMTGYAVLIPYTFSIFLKPLSAAFGWRREQISFALGIAAVIVAICAPLVGGLLDRYGARRTLLPCFAVFGLAFASLALLKNNLWHFYFVFVVLGLVGNGTTQLGYSRIVSTWFTLRRGMALAWISVGAGVGAMILPLIAASVTTKYGWRTAYATLGCLVLVVSLPLTALFARESEYGSAQRNQMKAGDSSVWQCIRARPFLFLILAIFLYSVAFNAIISHLSALLTDRGMSLRHSAEALSLLGACGLAGRMALGLVLDRVSAVRVSLLLFVVTAIGLVLLSQGSSHTAFVAIALLGFAAGGESDITPYLLSRYFGLRSFATLYGMAWTAFAAGTAVGSTLMGKLFAVAGGYAPGGIRLFAIPAARSALLMAIIPKCPPLQDQTPIPERTVATTI